MFHDVTGIFHHAGADGRLSGPAPEHADYGSFVAFSDPDGNGWLLQEIMYALYMVRERGGEELPR